MRFDKHEEHAFLLILLDHVFIRRNQDAIISAVEERLSIWNQLPASHQEDMQVLRYGPTNKYGAHMDGLGRVMSVLIYLIRE